MDLQLTDRAYVVTAASGGLGLATARQLLAEGARVVLVARDRAKLSELTRELEAEFGKDSAVFVTADLADPETAKAAVQLCLASFGRLDGAMVSVGGPPRGTALANTAEEWHAALDSVFLAALRVSREVLNHATGLDTALAWVLSSTAKIPMPSMAISNGLRPGLAVLLKQLADEIGPQGRRVVGLLPGSIATERVRWLTSQAPDPEATRQTAEAAIPLRRYGDPEEFARVAAFVLSPAASYLTGSMIAVDGGAIRAL